MTTLSSFLSNSQIEHIQHGFDDFIKLQGLIHSDNRLAWDKWLADETDLKHALLTTRDIIKRSQSLVGKQKYQNTPFNAAANAARELTYHLTHTAHGEPSATFSKRFMPLIVTAIEPVVEALEQMDQHQLVDQVDVIVAQLIQMLDQTTCYGSLQDAETVMSKVNDTLRLREENRKRSVKKPKNNVLSSILADWIEATEAAMDE